MFLCHNFQNKGGKSHFHDIIEALVNAFIHYLGADIPQEGAK